MGSDRNETGKRNGSGRGPKASGSSPFATRVHPSAGMRFSVVPDLGDAIDAILEAGAALLVGRTSDGGAVAITLLDGGERHRAYVGTQAELDDAFDRLTQRFADVTGDGRGAR